MGYFNKIVILLCFVLVSCTSENPSKSSCVYNLEEISGLESNASFGDRDALRELEICYAFQHKFDDRLRIHRKRLALKEPEALEEEVFRLYKVADIAPKCDEKRQILKQARVVAVTIARVQGVKIVETHELVKMADQKLSSLKCDEIK